jgi:hypothetical protein
MAAQNRCGVVKLMHLPARVADRGGGRVAGEGRAARVDPAATVV